MALEDVFKDLACGLEVMTADVPVAVQAELATYGVLPIHGVFRLRETELLRHASIKDGLNAPSTEWLQQLQVLASTGSTNTDLLELARKGPIDGVVYTAEVQTGGRGRRGRQWVSPFAQNIALSIGIAIDRPTAEIGAISLAIGEAIATELEALSIANVKLKWPNDLLIGQCKLGGILIELADAQRPAALIVGIGVNVNSSPGQDVTGDYRATHIQAHVSSACSRNTLVARLINGVRGAIHLYESDGFAPFKRKWSVRDVLLGKPVVLHGVEPPIRGVGVGIDDEGAYLIDTGTKTERAIGGELSLRAV